MGIVIAGQGELREERSAAAQRSVEDRDFSSMVHLICVYSRSWGESKLAEAELEGVTPAFSGGVERPRRIFGSRRPEYAWSLPSISHIHMAITENLRMLASMEGFRDHVFRSPSPFNEQFARAQGLGLADITLALNEAKALP